MDHLNFYLETLDKITAIVNETTAPFAQILMFGGQLPNKEKKTLDEVGKITAAIFDILKENGYPVTVNGNLQTLQVEGKVYYCAATDDKPQAKEQPQKVSETEQTKEPKLASAPIIEEPSKAEPMPEEKPKVKEPSAPLPTTQKEPEPKEEEDIWVKALKDDAPADKDEKKSEGVWDVSSEEDIWSAALSKPEETVSEDTTPISEESKDASETETDDDIWIKALQETDEKDDVQNIETTDTDTENEDIWVKALKESESGSKETKDKVPETEESENIWVNALSENTPLKEEEKKKEDFPNETDWWAQIDQTMKLNEAEIKENPAAKAVDEAANTTVEETDQSGVYMPGKAVFNFNGTGFADDKEGRKQTYSTFKDGVFYDLYELMIIPPIESGRKPEPISAMVAPITIPSASAPSIPLIATFTFRGKHYTVSSLEAMEKGRNLCLINIENYNLLIRGFFNDNMKFNSMICTAGESIKEGVRLEVKSIKQYGKLTNPGVNTKNGLAFKTNENRTELLCNIFPLSDDGAANFVCITRSLDFIDYHYHSENVHGAQEINVNINNEKTIIRCAYVEDKIVSEIVEVI